MNLDDLQLVSAEIVSVKPSLLRSSYVSEVGSEVFAANYAYLVDGTTYQGTMYIGNPDRVGEVFDMRYDPTNPQRNTAPDQALGARYNNAWSVRIAVFIVGVIILLLVIHFFPHIN